MFLYARLIIDYLSKQLFRTSIDLRDAIQELPPEMKGLWVVNNVSILSWVVIAHDLTEYGLQLP